MELKFAAITECEYRQAMLQSDQVTLKALRFKQQSYVQMGAINEAAVI